jgi:putative transposase
MHAERFKGYYRRNLPHIVTCERPLFITCTTVDRQILPPGARTIALRHALHDHGSKIMVDVVGVMPDHMHLVFTLLHDEMGNDFILAEIMKGIKGTSARNINRLLGRTAQSVWQDESMDHVMRRSDWSRGKVDYVCENPVAAGLVTDVNDYPWLWRSWIEGGDKRRVFE